MRTYVRGHFSPVPVARDSRLFVEPWFSSSLGDIWRSHGA